MLWKVRQIKWLPHQLKATPSKMRWKRWCAWSSFQSCIPDFKGYPLVWRLRMGSWISGRVLLWCWWSLCSLSTCVSQIFSIFAHEGGLHFAVFTTDLGLSATKTEMPPPSKAQVNLCWETKLAWFCWRAGIAATSQHPLHLHLAHTTRVPGECFNTKGYLQFSQTFPGRVCFLVVACKKEHRHSGSCKHVKCSCQVWWSSTLLWPKG